MLFRNWWGTGRSVPRAPFLVKPQAIKVSYAQEDRVRGAWGAGAHPKNIMATGAQRHYNRPREILVREKKHLCRNWIGAKLVRQVAGVRQARQDVLPGEARIIVQDIRLASTGGE